MAHKFKEIPLATARPDERGRITLGSTLTSGVSRYDIFVDETSGEVLLRPYKEIPAIEAWLYKNRVAHKLVLKGIEAAKAENFTEIDLDETNWIDKIKDED